ncbi:MAG: hypothetical protein SVM80_09115 [Halobacteriota archaeon]|nr:hypothetical protein [Halobacteriota archaeon]
MKRRRELKRDRRAQVLMIEYILILSIAVVFMGMLFTLFDDMIDDASRQAMIEQYNDIGNVISGGIGDVYLSGVKNGTTAKVIKIPVSINEHGYVIECNTTDEFGRQSIKISAGYMDVYVYVPLNRIDSSVNITGTAYSGSGKVTISHDAGTNIIELV